MNTTNASTCDADNFVFSPTRLPGRPEPKPSAPPSANRLRQLRIDPADTPNTCLASPGDIPSVNAPITRFRTASC